MCRIPPLLLKWIGIVTIGAIFSCAILFRLIFLDHIPGLNGDEAWYGIQALNLMYGRPLEWMAPSGRPLLNFFFFIPIFILQLFCEPAFWILRFPSVIASIIAIFLSYRLFLDILGRPAAISLALLTATLPINIAYSRFGWDPSLLIVYAVLIIYFSFRGSLKGVLISTLLGLTAHPVIIFLGPVVVMTALTQNGSALLPSHPLQKKIGAVLILTCIIAVAVYAAGIEATTHRLSTPQDAWLFLSLIGGLFSGETVYRYIVDPATTLAILDPASIGAILAVLSAIAFWRISSKTSQIGALAFLSGIFFALLCGYLMFGPWLLLPHTERYGIYLVFPLTLLFVIILHGAFTAERQHWPVAIVMALSLSLLAGFHRHYLQPIRETGGNSQIAFRTGVLDPKQVAYLGILDETRGRPVRIFAHQWWIWQPLKYLASKDPTVEVIELREFSRPIKGDYVVTFAGEPLDIVARKDPSTYATRWSVLDYARREVIAVYRL
ncbi:MAG TPA: hypothetical protein PKH10_01270 [bacterium]|nr:hypothetical protein [bacterium]